MGVFLLPAVVPVMCCGLAVAGALAAVMASRARGSASEYVPRETFERRRKPIETPPPDPPHEDSDSDREESTESESSDSESESSGGRSESSDDSTGAEPAVKVAVLNVRSANNKMKEISRLITRKNLDLLLTTETWLRRHDGDEVIHEHLPPNFNYNHWTRTGRGGGVASHFSELLQHQHILYSFRPALTTFEFVAIDLQHPDWSRPVLVLIVYRPPKGNLAQFDDFLREFQKLLDEIYLDYDRVLIAGDFNIWVDDEKKTETKRFLEVLRRYGLIQHVDQPTHSRHHTLDLIISRNVLISDLFIRNDGLSDHFTIYFYMRPKPKTRKKRSCSKRFRR